MPTTKVINIEKGGEDYTNGVFDLIIMTNNVLSDEKLAAIKSLIESESSPSTDVRERATDDLQVQVRDHIKHHDLFDWHEALSDNEMTLLENLLLTFNPLCPPGSIGFEEQKRHITGVLSTQPAQRIPVKAIEALRKMNPYEKTSNEHEDSTLLNKGFDTCCNVLQNIKEGDLAISLQSTPLPVQGVEDLADEIIKKNIPNGIVNIKGKGDGKPQYKAEIDIIKKCMQEYAERLAGSSISPSSVPVSIDIVEQLRKANPNNSDDNVYHWTTWDLCCNKLEEIVKSLSADPVDGLIKALEWYADSGNYMSDNNQLATAYGNNKLSNKAREALDKFKSK
jgi:hypothetical protein